MVKVEVSEIIRRPVEEVFAFITDYRNDVRWQDGLLEVRLTPDGPVSVGTQVHEVRKFMGWRIESTGVITEYIPNVKVARKTVEGPNDIEGYTTFEPVDGDGEESSSTKVTTHMEMEAGGFMALTEPLMSSGLRRALQKNFGDLKDLLESGVLSAEQEAAKA
jgi:uncharacterized membrane protein